MTGSKNPSVAPPKENPNYKLKFTPHDTHEVLVILETLLNKYVSMGAFHGSVGASLETIMKLDLAISLVTLILNA